MIKVANRAAQNAGPRHISQGEGGEMYSATPFAPANNHPLSSERQAIQFGYVILNMTPHVHTHTHTCKPN